MKILLSIKPQYAEKIFEGSKRFEFRKLVHKNKRVKTVVVYATLPVGKVIGEFSIRQIHSESPTQLWHRTRNHSGISEQYFNEYFAGRHTGFAIEVESATRYKQPKELKSLLPNGYAPQSFVYLG